MSAQSLLVEDARIFADWRIGYGSTGYLRSIGQKKALMLNYDYKPLSLAGRATLLLGSAVLALRNPARGDLVAAVGETTGTAALRNMRNRMSRSIDGSSLLRAREQITPETVPIQKLLSESPEDSFGFAYAKFMDDRGFSSDERAPVRFIDDEELAYVMLRYRQVHDFWHVLTDLPTTVLGELGLKWFEWSHTRLPSCLLSATVGSASLSARQQMHLAQTMAPWALTAGETCVDLMCIRYEDLLGKPLEEVRRELRISKAPEVLERGS